MNLRFDLSTTIINSKENLMKFNKLKMIMKSIMLFFINQKIYRKTIWNQYLTSFNTYCLDG